LLKSRLLLKRGRSATVAPVVTTGGDMRDGVGDGDGDGDGDDGDGDDGDGRRPPNGDKIGNGTDGERTGVMGSPRSTGVMVVVERTGVWGTEGRRGGATPTAGKSWAWCWCECCCGESDGDG